MPVPSVMTEVIMSVTSSAVSLEMTWSPVGQLTSSPPCETRKWGVVGMPSFATTPNARTICTMGTARAWPNAMAPSVAPV